MTEKFTAASLEENSFKYVELTSDQKSLGISPQECPTLSLLLKSKIYGTLKNVLNRYLWEGIYPVNLPEKYRAVLDELIKKYNLSDQSLDADYAYETEKLASAEFVTLARSEKTPYGVWFEELDTAFNNELDNYREGLIRLLTLIHNNNPDVLVFLDKSARYVAYMLRVMHHKLFPNEPFPKTHFINYGMEIYFAKQAESVTDPELIKDLQLTYPAILKAQSILVVNEYSEEGGTLSHATQLLQNVAPQAQVTPTVAFTTEPTWAHSQIRGVFDILNLRLTFPEFEGQEDIVSLSPVSSGSASRLNERPRRLSSLIALFEAQNDPTKKIIFSQHIKHMRKIAPKLRSELKVIAVAIATHTKVQGVSKNHAVPFLPADAEYLDPYR